MSVNAPKAGKITALLAEEEDNVTVGQDLFKFEPGAAGECKYAQILNYMLLLNSL